MSKTATLLLLCTALFAQQKGTLTDTRDGKVYKTIFCIIICCFCIFTCKTKETEKPKEEIKKIGNIDKPLNLSLHFNGPGQAIRSDTIDGNIIKTLKYPYSIKIVNDSIMIFTSWSEGDNKYRGKLTDEQHLKIKNMVSALNQEYKWKRGPYDAMICILKINNQVHYEQQACASNPEFSMSSDFSPMPKEILLLFQYIVDLSPVRTMKRRQMKYIPPPPLTHQKGTFTDTRDGKTYKTVKIGEQVWMGENLNYEANGSKCYKNEPANCKKYGRLYNWETAIKACPNGWHLPFREEWDVLTEAIGGEGTAGRCLKSTSGWNSYNGGKYSGNGDDKYDFSALPGGFGKSDGDFSIGETCLWWSASSTGIGLVDYSKSAEYYPYDKDFLLSVRCLKD